MQRSSAPVGWLIMGDGMVVVAAWTAAAFTRFLGLPPAYNLDALLHALPLFLLATLGLLAVYGLYERHPAPWPEQGRSILIAVIFGAVLAMALSFFARTFAVPRSAIGLEAIYAFLGLYLYRLAAYRDWQRRQGPLRVLHVQAHDANPFPSRVDQAVRLVGAFRVDPLQRQVVQGLTAAVQSTEAQALLVDQDLPETVKEMVVLFALDRGLDVLLVPSILDLLALRARPITVGDQLALDLSGSAAALRYHQLAKRAMDVALASLFLVLSSPLLLVLATIVFLDDGLPVLYRQERLGQHGRSFTLCKFRTMVRNAESSTGPVLSRPDDPRLTRSGRWLRQLHLDEMPQLWNVLKGDMSLVGPRPERPLIHQEVACTVPTFDTRLRLLPGMTGLAQVHGRYDTHPREKLKFDLLYAMRSSVSEDLRILAQTLRELLRGLGKHRGHSQDG